MGVLLGNGVNAGAYPSSNIITPRKRGRIIARVPHGLRVSWQPWKYYIFSVGFIKRHILSVRINRNKKRTNKWEHGEKWYLIWKSPQKVGILTFAANNQRKEEEGDGGKRRKKEGEEKEERNMAKGDWSCLFLLPSAYFCFILPFSSFNLERFPLFSVQQKVLLPGF